MGFKRHVIILRGPSGGTKLLLYADGFHGGNSNPGTVATVAACAACGYHSPSGVDCWQNGQAVVKNPCPHPGHTPAV